MRNILLTWWRKLRTQANPATMSSSEFGRWAEKQAEAFLRKQGFKILARNFRTRRGELDIVAQDADEVVFVEVKAVRNSDAEPQRKVDAHKRQCLAAAARFFIARYRLTDRPARFDIVTIKLDPAGQKQVEHEPNAFQVE